MLILAKPFAFAQLAHFGSQSRVPGQRPVAPLPVPNALTDRPVAEAGEDEIQEAILAFGSAAVRAAKAGFDGVHIHGAIGYLISEFSSPLTNHRDDGWGGSVARRDRFAYEVVRAVREAAPSEMPVTMKLGMFDACAGYFLRKSPDIEDDARKIHFHPLLCLAEVSRLGHPFKR